MTRRLLGIADIMAALTDDTGFDYDELLVDAQTLSQLAAQGDRESIMSLSDIAKTLAARRSTALLLRIQQARSAASWKGSLLLNEASALIAAASSRLSLDRRTGEVFWDSTNLDVAERMITAVEHAQRP